MAGAELGALNNVNLSYGHKEQITVDRIQITRLLKELWTFDFVSGVERDISSSVLWSQITVCVALPGCRMGQKWPTPVRALRRVGEIRSRQGLIEWLSPIILSLHASGYANAFW